MYTGNLLAYLIKAIAYYTTLFYNTTTFLILIHIKQSINDLSSILDHIRAGTDRVVNLLEEKIGLFALVKWQVHWKKLVVPQLVFRVDASLQRKSCNTFCYALMKNTIILSLHYIRISAACCVLYQAQSLLRYMPSTPLRTKQVCSLQLSFHGCRSIMLCMEFFTTPTNLFKETVIMVLAPFLRKL